MTSLIVRNETPAPKRETFEVRTARMIADNGMNGWSQEAIEAAASDFDNPVQEAAALIKRQRRNAAANPTPDTAWMWTH